jgi:hypothetical protein
MTSPIDKLRRQIDDLRMAIASLSQYIAGLEHRMNSLTYALDTQANGANCAGAATKQVICPAPQDAGSGDLLHAHPSFADTDGSTSDADLDLT